MYAYKLGGMLITDELYHDDLEAMTFGRKDQNELMHYGIKGQSWGKRRFQNEDGSLTMAGRNRYDVGDPRQGVTAYSDTGGRGGSGVNYNRLLGTGGSTRSATANQAPARLVGSNPKGRANTSTTAAKQKVANTTNAGRKAADNLFGRIGNWASNAAKDVGNFATNTYNDASKAVTNVANDVGRVATNAYNDASKWVEDRAKDVGNTVTNTAANLSNTPEYRDAANAVNDAKRWVGNAANDVGKTAQNAAKDAGNWLGNAFNGAKNWVSDRAQDVGRAATNAYNDASKAVTGAANDVGNFVKNAPQNISDWYTGDKAGREAQRYDNVVQNFERNAERNINSGVDKMIDSDKWPDSAYDLETNQKMQDKVFNEGLKQRNLGYNQDDIAAQYGWKADKAQAQYDAAPRQLLERAGNWIGDRAQDVGKTVSNVYNDVSKAAGDAVNWVGDRARDVGNLVSNQDEKRAAENAQNVADRVLDDAIARSGEYVPDEKGGEDLYIRDYNDAKVVDAADKRAADAQQAYENHPLTKIQNAANDVGNFVSNTANDVKNLFSDGSKEREALAEARSKVNKFADDPEFMAYFSKNYPEEAKKYAEEQAEARKQLEQAEKNYMDFSNNPTNTVARALNLPNNKGNWAFAVPGNEQYLQTMNTGFVPKTENIADWFTGNNYKRTADTHNQYAKDYDDLAEQAYAYGRESAETGRGPSQDWWNSEGDYIKNTYAKEDRDIANANMNMYNNAPRQKIVNAANQVGETISGAAKDVGNWAGNAANDVANWGGQQVENGKKLFKKIFG